MSETQPQPTIGQQVRTTRYVSENGTHVPPGTVLTVTGVVPYGGFPPYYGVRVAELPFGLYDDEYELLAEAPCASP